VYIVLFIATAALIAVAWIQKNQNVNQSLVQVQEKPYGTITTLIDTLENTWSLNLTGPYIQYLWTPKDGAQMILWDSNIGVCDYTENNASLTAAVNMTSVSFLNSSVVLGQTPMYIDPLGIQRTFQLKMYSGDLRIESTNGERARNGGLLTPFPSFWSIWGRDITGLSNYLNQPSSWPISSLSDVIWQAVSPNFGFVAQFLTSGDLITHASYNLQNYFQASTWVQPLCDQP
jgi:hypothetical protein